MTTILVIGIIRNDKNSCHFFLQKKLLFYIMKYFMENTVEILEVFKLSLYNKLKDYRAKLGVNQQQMGALVGTSRQTISQIERGDYSPSVTLALKIAKVCGVTVEDIFVFEDE